MRIIISLFAMFFVVGCGTINQDVENLNVGKLWDNRIGTYTYNDAINDWGQPDEEENLEDASLIATWIRGGDSEDVKSKWDLHLVFNKDKVLTRWRIEDYD